MVGTLVTRQSVRAYGHMTSTMLDSERVTVAISIVLQAIVIVAATIAVVISLRQWDSADAYGRITIALVIVISYIACAIGGYYVGDSIGEYYE